MKVHAPQINDFGGAPVAEHDYACPVYHELPAVLNMGTGVFQPSWSAQADGWITVRIRWAWLRRWLQKRFAGF